MAVTLHVCVGFHCVVHVGMEGVNVRDVNDIFPTRRKLSLTDATTVKQ